ncbi:MAG: metallophosphoesterase [Candidatus Sumerlaeota bacterium]|nr:metallophosphoesterase [Candidatus Sumerlaeota bacterium]
MSLIPPPPVETSAPSRRPNLRQAAEAWTLLALQPALFVVMNNIYWIEWRGGHDVFDVIRQAYAFETLGFPLSLAAAGGLGMAVWRQERERRWLFRASLACLVGAFLCFGAHIYATYVEPQLLFVRHVEIATPKVERPVRILHFADFQVDRVGPYERRAVAKMRSLAPDLILFTGDLAQPLAPATFESVLPKLAALLETLEPPLGKFAVYGDIDGPLRKKMDGHTGGFRWLNDEEASIPLDGGRLRLLGLSLGDSAVGARRQVKDWLAEGGAKNFTIVLGHMPDFAMSLTDVPADLCLAGHTHGGQVRIPFYGPLMTLSAVPRDWARGFRPIGATRLNVTAGVGSEHGSDLPSLRVFCPSEMTLIELTPEK